ncbi:hypothetical protein B4U80_06615 [Leptotrombidium deliense]|uniref:Uncharacterized protein n=1 Tax=Leptotrombidium deliense TaxID=299467 RepID=A0A443Q9U0_9ACAR|nr:hypothetical protein B4U80_06615 [Leptotrombidium deliense]
MKLKIKRRKRDSKRCHTNFNTNNHRKKIFVSLLILQRKLVMFLSFHSLTLK